MTKTQWLDAFRNIGKQLVSFLSVIAIAMLAVLIYLGINYSAVAMHRNVSAYYTDRKMQDLQIVSPLLLTPEDLQAISALDGISDAEGCDQTTAWLRTERENYELTVLSFTERIAVPEICEGRAPQSGQECMMEQKLALQTGLQIGDHVRLTGVSPDSIPLLMTETEFTVTGFFTHPDHITDNVSYNYYVIVTEEAFDQSILEGNWPRVRVTLSDPPDNRFSKDYWKTVASAEELLKALALERSPLRYDEVRETYEKRLSDGEAQLLDAKEQLEDADRQLRAAEAEIHDVEEQIRDGEQQLREGEQQLRDGEAQIADGEQQLQEGEQKLRDVEAQLRDAEAQIADGERQLQEAEAAAADSIGKLDRGKALLAEAERLLGLAPGQLAAGEARLRDAEGELADGKEKLDAALAALKTAESYIYTGYDWMVETGVVPTPSEISEAKEIAEKFNVDLSAVPDEFPEDFLSLPEEEAIQWLKDNFGYSSMERQYQNGLEEYRDGLAAYEQGRNDYYYEGEQYLDGLISYEKAKKVIEDAEAQLQELYDARDLLEQKKQELEEGRSEFEAGREELETGREELETSRSELEAARQELEEKRAELLDAKRRIEEAKVELEEKKQEYEDGLQDYEDFRAKLDAAREEMEHLEAGAWIVMNNRAETGYVFCEENASNLVSLSGTFALLFIVIAALVIYASVGRMVDEQSVLVGTTKALGFYNREVWLKYMVFGVLGTMAGVLLGILLAWCLLQPMILHMYAPYYNMPEAQKSFLPGLTLIVVLGGLVLSILAVWLACNRLLKRTAMQLMRGEEPGILRRSRKNRSSGSLYTRLIILNMTSDLKRVLVTIISIAGCCMLLLIGFMLKYGQDRIVDRQFNEVQTYDAELRFDPAVKNAEEVFSELLDDFGADHIAICREDHLFSCGDNLSATRLVAAEPDSLPGYYNLWDPGKKEDLSLPEHGVLIPLRLHEDFGIRQGTTLTLYDDSMQQYETETAGVFNAYCGRIFFLTNEAYREIFSKRAVHNCFYVKLNGRELSELTAAVHDQEGFLTITDATSKRTQLEQTAAALNVLIFVMIVIAGLMAFFILVNLSGSYMIHKKTELTIMRINGFTVKECTRYAATELVVTTIVGILLGILVGAPLGYWIQRMMESTDIQQVRGADWRSILFSVLITALFSLIINGWALRKVKTLKLSDV